MTARVILPHGADRAERLRAAADLIEAGEQ